MLLRTYLSAPALLVHLYREVGVQESPVRPCPPAVRRTCHATPTPVRSRYTLVVIHPFSSPVYRQSTAISCSSTDRQRPLVHNYTSGAHSPCTALHCTVHGMEYYTSIVPIVPRVQYSIRLAHHRSWWQVQLRDHHHRSLTAGALRRHCHAQTEALTR
jgi:hypothetical protein